MNDELKAFLKKLSPAGWLLLLKRYRHERRYRYYMGLRPEQYPEAMKKLYKKRTGQRLNLENPQTYNEKIQWLKLYDSTPLKAKISDRYMVREWVAEKIGAEYLVPLLGVYDKFDDINFDNLPDKFAIKTNHDGMTKLIVTDKLKFDVAEARDYFDHEMRINTAFYTWLEPYYRDIVPKIIIEEYLENGANDLYDYKFMCFDGKVECIWFQAGWQKGQRSAVFDREWKRLPIKCGRHHYEEDVEKPDNLDRMIKLAETLAEGFAHVRVDLFRLNDGTIKFGEMLFSPESGRYKWDPPEYDKIIGDLIKLPIDKK